MQISKISSMIDHTILKPTASIEQVIKLCEEAKEYGFASVCVNPCYVKLVSEQLKDTEINVCTVVGFPLGENISAIKAQEAACAVELGAQEIDMVINIGAMKDGKYSYVENEIGEVVKASKKALVKVILETCYLNDKEKEKACEIAKKAGAAFVKTSTGFGTGGATVGDVQLMKNIVGENMGVKASGGIGCLKDAIKMIEAGASRIGTSNGVKIMGEMIEISDGISY